ncbi:MAG: enoyl-CoA hydratase/isomerase family protein [Phycisphaerales bacterium]
MIASQRTEQDGAVLRTISLDRPSKRNALTPDMLTRLTALVLEASDQGEALLLRGEGPVFCAGFDLRMCHDSRDGSTLRLLLSGLSDACRALRRCPRPVVIAAHGGAIAGGCALLGGADFVVADRAARFGYPVARLGISPAVTVPFLRTVVGDGAARHRTLLPELFDSDEAERIGLISHLVETPEAVHPAAEALAWELAKQPAHALGTTKRWLIELERSDASTAFDRALEVSLGLTGGDEERARLDAAFPDEPRQSAQDPTP